MAIITMTMLITARLLGPRSAGSFIWLQYSCVWACACLSVCVSQTVVFFIFLHVYECVFDSVCVCVSVPVWSHQIYLLDRVITSGFGQTLKCFLWSIRLQTNHYEPSASQISTLSLGVIFRTFISQCVPLWNQKIVINGVKDSLGKLFTEFVCFHHTFAN